MVRRSVRAKIVIVIVSVLGTILGGISSAHAVDVNEGLERFVDMYKCTLIEGLKAIREHGTRSQSANRYIILTNRRSPQRFAQCIFFEYDWKVLCEASSGRYGPVAGKPFHLEIDAERAAALKKLGFIAPPPDKVENYKQELALGDPPDLERIARLILSTQYLVYQAHQATEMDIDAPLISKSRIRVTPCKPVS